MKVELVVCDWCSKMLDFDNECVVQYSVPDAFGGPPDTIADLHPGVCVERFEARRQGAS